MADEVQERLQRVVMTTELLEQSLLDLAAAERERRMAGKQLPQTYAGPLHVQVERTLRNWQRDFPELTRRGR